MRRTADQEKSFQMLHADKQRGCKCGNSDAMWVREDTGEPSWLNEEYDALKAMLPHRPNNHKKRNRKSR